MDTESVDIELEKVPVPLENVKETEDPNEEIDEPGETEPLQSEENTPNEEETEETEKTSNVKKLSKRELTCLVLAIGASSVGCCICFAQLVIQSTPFLESCGFSRSFTSIFWIIGPLFSVTAQPIIGFINDNFFIPFFGRRRPVIILGGILCACSLCLFSNSKVIGQTFFPYNQNSELMLTQIIAACSFFLLDSSLRLTFVAQKSLIVDKIPQSQQMFANAIVGGFFVGFGNILGFLLGAVPFKMFVPYVNENIQVLYTIDVFVLLFSLGVTCVFVREKKKEEKSSGEEEINEVSSEIVETEEPSSEKKKMIWIFFSNLCSIFTIFCYLPVNFWFCYVIQSITLFTKYILYVYISTFVATVVFEGDPLAPTGSKEKEDFENGLMWSNFGGILMAFSAILYGLLLPILSKYISVRLLWIWGQFSLGAAVMIGSLLSFSSVLELFPFFFFGMVQTSMNVIPWAIVNSITRDSQKLTSKKATIQTIFYTTTAFPQLFVALIGGPMLGLFQEMGLPDLNSLFFLAGVISWMSIIFVVFLKIPKSMNEKDKLGIRKVCCFCWKFRNILRKKRNDVKKETLSV